MLFHRLCRHVEVESCPHALEQEAGRGCFHHKLAAFLRFTREACWICSPFGIRGNKNVPPATGVPQHHCPDWALLPNKLACDCSSVALRRVCRILVWNGQEIFRSDVLKQNSSTNRHHRRCSRCRRPHRLQPLAVQAPQLRNLDLRQGADTACPISAGSRFLDLMPDQLQVGNIDRPCNLAAEQIKFCHHRRSLS